MHCPTCGTEALADQKFCRSCGMELQVISRMVAKHLSGTDPALLPFESDAKTIYRMPTLVFSGIVSFIILIIGMALLVAGKQFPDQNWIGLVGILLLPPGILIAAYGVLSPLWQIKKNSSHGGLPTCDTATCGARGIGIRKSSRCEAKRH